MDYQVFERLGDSQFGQQEAEDGQAYMERVFRKVFSSQQEEDGEQVAEHVYEMMQSRFVACGFQEQTLDVGFQVRQWELNPMGNLHGGILMTAVDMTCGLLTRFYRQTGKIDTRDWTKLINQAINRARVGLLYLINVPRLVFSNHRILPIFSRSEIICRLW